VQYALYCLDAENQGIVTLSSAENRQQDKARPSVANATELGYSPKGSWRGSSIGDVVEPQRIIAGTTHSPNGSSAYFLGSRHPVELPARLLAPGRRFSAFDCVLSSSAGDRPIRPLLGASCNASRPASTEGNAGVNGACIVPVVGRIALDYLLSRLLISFDGASGRSSLHDHLWSSRSVYISRYAN
jgi:hypothetical protein